jgi:hypothetical protein
MITRVSSSRESSISISWRVFNRSGITNITEKSFANLSQKLIKFMFKYKPGNF